jgi:hypothetical protein
MAHESPSSPAAAAADSADRFSSAAAVGAVSADTLSAEDDNHGGIAAMDGLGDVAGLAAVAAAAPPKVVSCFG